MKLTKLKFLTVAIFLQLFTIATVSLSQPAWKQKKNLDIAQYRGCSFVIGGKAYVGLGLKEKDSAPGKDFYEFNPSANTWTKIADFPGTARYFAIAFSINNRGYVGLGTDGTNMFKDLWEYNPTTNEWTQKTDFPAIGRSGAVAIVIDGKGYVGLGVTSANAKVKDWWEYDPADAVNGNDANGNTKGKWTQRTSFAGSARSFAIGFSGSSKGYVGFGNDASSFKKDIWEYDPSIGTNGQWTIKKESAGEQRAAASSFVIGKKGYVVGGYFLNFATLTYLKDVWEYDMENNSWDEKHAFPESSRAAAIGFAIESLGYFGLGYSKNDIINNDLGEFTPLAPRRPKLSVSTNSETKISVNWYDNSKNVTEFHLQQSEDNNTDFQTIRIGQGSVYFASDLKESTKYNYRIRAFNGTSYSDYSTVQSTYTRPAPPTQLTAVAASDSEINLKWSDNSSGEEGYLIERASADNTNFVAIATVDPNTTTYQDINTTGNKLYPRSTYYYRVAAINASTKSTYSAEVEVKTLNPFPAPTELTASSTSDSEISLTWKDNSDNETSFLIQRSTGNNLTYTDLSTLEANATTYVDKKLAPSTTYFYRIKASNAMSSSAYSTETSAVTLITTGVEDNIPTNQVIISPNPAHQAIYVTTTENFASQIIFELTNSRGQLVKKGKLDKSGYLNIDDLNTGIYYLNIITSKEHIPKKIIKY